MAVEWGATFIFTDERGIKTTRTHYQESAGLDMALEFSAFVTDVDGLVAAYRAVSDAAVSVRFTVVDGDYAGESPAAESDVTDVAAINTFLRPPPDQKLHPLAIPAPIDALFIGGGTKVDLSNAALIAFVAELAANWEVSDGESIDTSENNGIESGEWRSRAKNPR